MYGSSVRTEEEFALKFASFLSIIPYISHSSLLAVMVARNPSLDNQGKDSSPATLFVRYVITEMLPDKIRDSGQ
jgi:hypothetical protein